MYLRAYFHNRLNLLDTFSVESRVIDAVIQVDAIKSGTSTFRLVSVPSAVNNGDIMTLCDKYGTQLYQGVVIRIYAAEIECDQIDSLFSDNWIYERNEGMTLEKALEKSIRDNFIKSNDPIVRETFKDFQIQVSSATVGTIPKRDANHVKNFRDHILYMFENYDIKVSIQISMAKGVKPTLSIGKIDLEKIVLGNNTKVIQNISPVTQIYEVNKLVVYDESGKNHRGTFYATNSGITENAEDLTRFNVVKTNFSFSDESIGLIKAQNLRNNMYNHKVELDLVYNNLLYDFKKFELGQEFEIFVNNAYFKTILTGYEYDIKLNTDIQIVHLIFGKVRLRISQLW